jgi:hypothetical protein
MEISIFEKKTQEQRGFGGCQLVELFRVIGVSCLHFNPDQFAL